MMKDREKKAEINHIQTRKANRRLDRRSDRDHTVRF